MKNRNKQILVYLLYAFFRSFTYSKNSSEPSIEPFGTPHIIISSSVFLPHYLNELFPI